MSKELKDLIESIDSTNRAHSDLERIIRYLREEVQRLTFTINEQKEVIKNQRVQLANIEDNNLPEDIQILKEIITNQRQEIIKKDKDIEILKLTLEDISSEFEKLKDFNEENEEIVYLNKVIVQLTEENELNNLKIKELEEKLTKPYDELNSKLYFDSVDKDQQLIDAKKMIFQLTEENGINRVKIESLKSELEETLEKKNKVSEELNYLRGEHENLIIENNDYKEKVEYLQQKIEQTIKNYLDEQKSDSNIQIEELKKRLIELKNENDNLKYELKENVFITDELRNQNVEIQNELNEIKSTKIDKEAEYRKNLAQKEEELANINIKLQKIENVNKQLNELLIKLKKQEHFIENKDKVKIPIESSDRIDLRPPLFIKMFNLLEKPAQNQILELLIDNLNNTIREKRITAIKSLSMIRTSEVFDVFKELINDEDWIIKLYVIKALVKFENPEVKDLLNTLSKDNDCDVRETAYKMLKKLNR